MSVHVDRFMDVIDSRDIIARIEELEESRNEAGDDAAGKAIGLCLFDDAAQERARQSAVKEWDEADNGELSALKALASECEDCSEWEDGTTLIRGTYFKEYAEDFANESGAVPEDRSWPMTHIDWDAAADELKSDYTSVDFAGTEYFIRS